MEVGLAGVGGGMGSKCRQLYLNNKKKKSCAQGIQCLCARPGWLVIGRSDSWGGLKIILIISLVES